MNDDGAWNDLQLVLQEAARLAIAYRNTMRDRPVVSDADPEAIRRRLARYTFADPIPAVDVLADVADLLERWSVHVNHPRYFGLFNPTTIPIASAGELMAGVYNTQLAAWAHAAAGNEMERHVIRFLLDTVGLPAGSGGHFTTGGQESNLTAVAVALTAACPDFDRRGARAFDRQPAIYLSAEAHHSFDKIAHLTGIGREAIRRVPVDASFRIDAGALADALDRDARNGFQAVMVVGTAGTTASGVVDPLRALAEICGQRKVWFHVDAAWGGAALFSRHRACLAGIEVADSITWDAHKWLSVPLGAGMLLCRHADLMARTFRVGHASYVPPSPAAVSDQYTTTAQWSRRFIGLKLFLALAALGRSGYTRLIDGQCDMGERLRAGLRRTGWTVVNETPLPLVCFTHPALDGPGLARVQAAITGRGSAWISTVRLPGTGDAFRACITSYETTSADIDALVKDLARAASEAGA